MVKRGRRLMLCVLLGVVTTLIVAWALAAWMPIEMYPRTVVGAFERWGKAWSITEARPFGVVDRWWNDFGEGEPIQNAGDVLRALAPRDPGTQVANARSDHSAMAAQRPGLQIWNEIPAWGAFASADRPPGNITIGSDTAFGWPRPCLWYGVESTLDRFFMSITSDRLEGGVHLWGPVSSRGRDWHALPLRPIWSGLAVNVAIFAAIWWVALTGVPAARRALRRKRGWCPWCGYDREGLAAGAVCPECGRPAAQ